jgi:RecG-like helicase
LKIILSIFIFSITLSLPFSYAEWSFLGDHNKLKGFVITEAGDVALYKPRTFSKNFDEQSIYYFNSGNEISFCFKVDNNSKLEIDNEAVLLLIDINKNLKLAFFKTLVDKIDVYMIDFTKTHCS